MELFQDLKKKFFLKNWTIWEKLTQTAYDIKTWIES